MYECMLGLHADSERRYEKFIKNVIENEIVYGLKMPNGFCVCESSEHDNRIVMPF